LAVDLVDLDLPETWQPLDGQGMLSLTMGYARQFLEGKALADEFPLPMNPRTAFGTVRNVVLLGTGGGSGASGQLLGAYLFSELEVPFYLSQGYGIPRFVDDHSLVFAVSHSGNTEETVAAAQEAIDRHAKVIAISAGGRLAEIAHRENVPHLAVPGGLMPRAALGYLLVPILVILDRLGLVAPKGRQLYETIELFKTMADELGPEVPTAANPAKRLAVDLVGRFPVVYGSIELTAAVAARFKNQLAENSKVLSIANAVPALHHDEIVGWESVSAPAGDVDGGAGAASTADPVYPPSPVGLILIRDAEDPDKIRHRLEVTRTVLAPRSAAVFELRTRGTTRLARLFSGVYFADFVSIYLALARGIDPTPVPIIDHFKREMAR